jgi:hypothetical protein
MDNLAISDLRWIQRRLLHHRSAATLGLHAHSSPRELHGHCSGSRSITASNTGQADGDPEAILNYHPLARP